MIDLPADLLGIILFIVGIIRRGETLSLPTFKKLTGLADPAIRNLKKQGLKVRKVSTRKFITG